MDSRSQRAVRRGGGDCSLLMLSLCDATLLASRVSASPALSVHPPHVEQGMMTIISIERHPRTPLHSSSFVAFPTPFICPPCVNARCASRSDSKPIGQPVHVSLLGSALLAMCLRHKRVREQLSKYRVAFMMR